MSYFTNLLSASAHSLLLPKEHKSNVERYVSMHQVTRAPRERAPFRRKLDFWAFSLAAALVKDLSPIEGPPSKWGEKFIDTKQVDMGNDLCSLLAVVALAKLGQDHENVADPSRIIDLANRLAAVGCGVVLNRLTSNTIRLRPLDRVIGLAKDLQKEVVSPVEHSEKLL